MLPLAVLALPLLQATAPPTRPATAPAEPSPIVLREALVLARGEAPRRAPFSWDPVAESLARGAWRAPAAGEGVSFDGGKERAWEAARAGDDDWLGHGALDNGYAFFSWEAPAEGAWILEASGHTLVFVNGEPRVGDPYQSGAVRLPVPLRAGRNEFLFLVTRGGRLRAALRPAGHHVELDGADSTVPDLVAGEAVDAPAAVVVANAYREPAKELSIVARILPDGPATWTALPAIAPYSARKVGFDLRGAAPAKTGSAEVEVTLMEVCILHPIEVRTAKLALRVRDPKEARKVTFRSAIDGSVQYYGLVPALPGPPGTKPGLVLSLHGAGVEASGQADCYAPKVGIHVVAATNRRPFGFDWEDWGRLDALEVLERAATSLGTDPARTWLTGHSMGGHGTWHLGTLFPDRFAAVAPSAGWMSFASYTGMNPADGERPVDDLMRRAASPSDTLERLPNLRALGVSILHGDADDNVPVAEARAMRTKLAEFHPDFAYHEEPGAGHWWGNACLDWPPFFEMFARRSIPKKEDVREVDFTTPNPGISARCQWLTIEQQAKALRPSRARLALDRGARQLAGTTENVARLAIDLAGLEGRKPVAAELDGQKLDGIPWPADGVLRLRRGEDRWVAAPPLDPHEKGPHRAGPFKEALRRGVVFVHGTRGTPEENAWALAKARYDAETFWVRGNASVDVVADTEFDPNRDLDRDVVLYGHADSNAHWGALLGTSPVQARRGALRAGSHEYAGDAFALLLVRPRPGSATASVAAVSGSGIVGLRVTDRLPYFVSGVHYPDWVVFGPPATGPGRLGLRAAGAFGNDWSLESGDSAY